MRCVGGDVILVVGGGQPTEDQRHGDHVLDAVVAIGRVVERPLFVDDANAGFVRADRDLLDETPHRADVPATRRRDSSGSTLSPAIIIDGMSARKLLSRICFARSGKNGMNNEAAAMLSMLPKFALVVIVRYLSVLANVLRPCSTPRHSTSRSCSSSTKSAASRATSTAPSTEMPTSAACKAGASLMPSPR